MKKLIKISSGLFVVLSILLFVTYQSSVESDLKIYFFDVGQGDAMLIRTPSHQNIIIDGGPDNSFITKLGPTLPFYDRTIDLMILTHPHDDHLSGLIEVLKRYQVKQVLYSGVLHSTDIYLEWLRVIKEKKIPLKIALRGQQYLFGKVNLEIIYPFNNLTNLAMENLNNSSIVSRLSYGKTTVLFTGDAEEAVEEQLIDYYKFFLKSLVLKVGHHGSDSSSAKRFLGQISPKYAIISVGADNKFGHPAPQTIFRLERLGAKIYQTDLNGDILLQSNGQNILFTSPAH